MNKTFFYGGVFSQWHSSTFKIDNRTYYSAEQWMMAEKARFFGDEESLAKILASAVPKEQKSLGRQVTPFDAEQWNDEARDVVYEGNWAKFTQNDDLLAKLLATRQTTLVSHHDRLWGIGLDKGDPLCEDESKWRGSNWLGEVLTKVREDIIGYINVGEPTCKAEYIDDHKWLDNAHVYDKTPPV